MWRRSGSDDALATIEAVYRDRFAGFVRLALAITGDEQAALDAVHDAFVRAVRYRRNLRDAESAPGWICRIVINEARRSRRVPPHVELPEAVIADGHDDGADVRAALASCPSASGSRCSCATTPTSTTPRSPRRSGSRAGRCRRRSTPPIRTCRRS